MAYASVKRPLEWEPMTENRPAKRLCRLPSPISANPRSQQEEIINTTPTKPSVFPKVVTPKCTPEYMSASIESEIKRLQRCKQLVQFKKKPENFNTTSDPLLTFEQVGTLCEKILSERESEIREHYDKILNEKLAEQYEGFVKFTQDQIQKSASSTRLDYFS